MTSSIRRLALTGAAFLGLSGMAQGATLIGLTSDGSLVRIDSETRRASSPVRVRGAEGQLLGIDMRPADGKLYGVTDSGQIVTIDPMSGMATRVSQLGERFESGGRAVVDFNPVADRLRLMGSSGVNFRVNVDNGQVVRDGQLKYQPGTPLADTSPRISAGAYTNSMQGAQQTALLTIDAVLGQLNLQAPPNDGVQQVRGRIGEGVPASAAFDILTEGTTNTGYLLAGGVLHQINLENGTPTPMGPVSGAAEVIDIAAMR
ncbi:DUF4394 domain-containing protein [Roseomonas sp. SSH11]|uniref:DUF4394 domain-containing protein n=1 Tax=Pararoseomonas baculiformis TaxID=2820812 RepID=A0ABS4AIU2_9PROT|nr:DUF4394 domain-containing protein [Pararoseomonas baculiformis]MBP0446440.1 DUF4394 domain-containing protein [Pararoseomonas baculiformis]